MINVNLLILMQGKAGLHIALAPILYVHFSNIKCSIALQRHLSVLQNQLIYVDCLLFSSSTGVHWNYLNCVNV